MSERANYTATALLTVVVACGGFTGTAYAENAVSRPYDSLKQLSNSNQSSAALNASAFLSSLSSDDLLRSAKDASLVRDSILLFQFVGKEMIRRIRNRELESSAVTHELARISEVDEYHMYFLLWALASTVQELPADEIRNVFDVTHRIVSSDRPQLFQKRLSALVASNSALEALVALDEADIIVVEGYGEQLLSIATDQAEDPEIRRAAIKGISEVSYRQAIPELLMLAQNTRIRSTPPVVRSVCLTLARFGVTEAILPIQHILETTDDKYVFGSASIALADIGGYMALRILVDNVGRMDGGFAGVAIQKLDTLILGLLLTHNEDSLSYAIRATEYLYKENQVRQYKSILKIILFSTKSKNLIRLTLARLQQLVDQKEAGEIVDKITFDSVYSDEWEWMERLAKAIPAKPQPTKVPTKETGGIEKVLRGINNWEYGDPGFRANGWIFVSERGHTGLMAGISSSNSHRMLEILSLVNPGVRDNAWSTMISDPDFWGTYSLRNASMTFARRRAVVGTANILVNYDIGYPWFPTIDLLRPHPNPGTKISPHKVSDLRCDGLIEYCYEYNGMSVWGMKSTHYDVSRTEWYSEHNDFYSLPKWNSCVETSPDVQCGRSADSGLCTYMTQSASGDLPTYEVSYSADCSTVDIYITATDQSGIHYIKAKRSGDESWTSSPIQPQHPNSASYTGHFSFPLSSSGWIYFYSKDNAGNYPDFAAGTYIELEATPASPSYVSPSDGATNQTQPVYLDWSDIGGADKYQVQVDNNSDFGSPEKDVQPSSSSYSASELDDGIRFYWRVRAHNSCGWGNWNSGHQNFTTTTSTAVDEVDSQKLPVDFVLSQNYPNPFNPETRIEFDLPRGSYVTIDVFNIVGRRISNLVNGRLSAGRKIVTWDGRDYRRQSVASGIYLYRIVTEDFTESRKMLLLK